MPRRVRPKGTRVSMTIPPGLEQRVERSPGVAAAMTQRVAAIAKLADQTCPVGDSGDLKASQVSEVRLGPNGPVGLIAYQMFYAHMVHNGTSHSTANPWLLNAALAVLVRRQGSAALSA